VRILRLHIPTSIIIYVVTDLLLATGGFLLAFWWLYDGTYETQLAESETLGLRVALFDLFVIGGVGATGLYGRQQRYRIEGILARLIVGLGFATAGLSLLDFVFDFIAWRGLWLLAMIVAGLLLVAARIVFYYFFSERLPRRRILVYGAGKQASNLLDLRRRSDHQGFHLVAFWPANGDAFVLDDPRVLTELPESLLSYVQQNHVDEIVVALDDRRRNLAVGDLLECRFTGLEVIDLIGFLERETGRVKVDVLNPSWLIFSEGFTRLGSTFLYRLLDLTVAVIAGIIAVPFAAIVSLAILIDDGAPVLYRQTRVGVNGKEFTLYKFRSMRTDAEQAGKAVWAEKNDTRVTRVGAIIRKLRLDELPQLFNVIKGDMSFVGPRPERPEFVQQLAETIPYYHQRHCVKPGITGWAQLSYPYGSTEKDALSKLEFDIYYVKNRSLIFNIVILLQTAEVILWQKGSR
jgi:sugar transferase (PEP-CTERM system associated)